MFRYILNRLIQLVPTLFGIYTLAFVLMRVLPGDPATFLIGFRDDEAALQNLKEQMRLDAPIGEQYAVFLGNALRGDLGRSYLTGQPVTEMIGEAFPNTLALGSAAMGIAILIGVPLGLVSALRRNSVWDNFARVVALLGVSIPVFVLGIQLQLFFGLTLRALPISGLGFDEHLILPAFALSLGTLALLARMTRSTMLDEINQEYVRTARAKGVRARGVVFRHEFRNALLPLITVAGGNLANLLSGALLVERIFSWPGMGRLLVDSIASRDYTVLQGCVIVFAILYAGVNLLIDLSYPLIDPRVRLR